MCVCMFWRSRRLLQIPLRLVEARVLFRCCLWLVCFRSSLDHPDNITRWQPRVHGYKRADWEREMQLRSATESMCVVRYDREGGATSGGDSSDESPARDRPPPLAPAPGSISKELDVNNWWEANQVKGGGGGGRTARRRGGRGARDDEFASEGSSERSVVRIDNTSIDKERESVCVGTIET